MNKLIHNSLFVRKKKTVDRSSNPKKKKYRNCLEKGSKCGFFKVAFVFRAIDERYICDNFRPFRNAEKGFICMLIYVKG